MARVAEAVDGVLGARGRSRAGIADGAFAAGLAAERGLLVPPGATVAFLAGLPVAVLERPELADLLVRLGLRTLGDLAALPHAAVAARFGPEGARAHRLACGLDARPPAPRHPPPDLKVVAELEPPADRVAVAAFVAKALADELAGRLRDLGLACVRLRVEAETEHGGRLVRRWRHPDGLAAQAMAERVRWQLDGWLAGGAAARPTGALTRLALAPDEVEVTAATGRQLGFWGEEQAADERAARALARLQGLLGTDAVTIPRLRGGRGPADRVALGPAREGRPPMGDEGRRAREGRPSAAGEGSRAREGPPPWPGAVPPPAPATVHAPPLPAEVQDTAGVGVGVTGRGLLTGTPPACASRERRTGWPSPRGPGRGYSTSAGGIR